MRRPPSLLRVGLTVMWAFVVVSVVWIRVAPAYNSAITAAANALLPDDLWLEAFSRSIVVRHVVGDETYRESINSLVLHSGLLIVIALVAGTPWRSVVWRGLSTVYVTVCFFLVQLAGMSVFAMLLRASLGEGVQVTDVNIGFAIFWALTPLVIGGGWAYAFWLPAFRVPRAAMGERESAG